MRHKAEKLLAKIYAELKGRSVNLIMKAFEDVAVNFAWEMLIGYGCKFDVTIDQLKAGFRDYSLPVPFRPTLNYDKMDSYYQYDMMKRLSEYPPFKTQTEIVRESMEKYYKSKYYNKRYYKCYYCEHSFLDVGVRRCPKCKSTHLYHITPAGYEKERARLRKPVKQNYVQANKHLCGISRYYKCTCCDHTFLTVNVEPRYCPECKSISFMPLSRYYHERARIRKQISRHYHKCSCCNHTYLGRHNCPRCENMRIDLECGLDIQACRDREKFLNTYGYVARPGIDLDDGDPDKQTPSLREQGFYSAQDVYDHTQREKGPTVEDVKNLYEFGRKDVEATDDHGLPVGYISYEDMAYLWECMPRYIKYGSYVADDKIRKRVKRILRK